MAKRVRITNSSLNAYGTRLITAGGDIEQYLRNPVLLYMHRRGDVIGLVKDIKVEGDEITGELVFDEASDLSVKAKKQYEFGSLRMVSAGVDILELSEDPELLVTGQTRPTVSKWKLVEVSLVDIGANDDAITLYRNGRTLELGKDGYNPLPIINTQTKEPIMELKQLALQLGLPENATEEQVLAKIGELNAAKQERDTLRTEKEQLTLSAITAAVDAAIGEKRLNADKKQQFIELGKKVGLEDLKSTLAAMAPAQKASDFINPASADTVNAYKKLSDVPSDKLLELRSEDPETYKALYKAEYGVECTL